MHFLGRLERPCVVHHEQQLELAEEVVVVRHGRESLARNMAAQSRG
jgi:hypothetical protein